MQFWSEKKKSLLPGLVLALVFFLVGIFVHKDFGLTIDEPAIMWAGQSNLKIISTFFSGGRGFDWPFHEVKGYYFIMDSLRALFAKTLQFFVPSMPFYQAFHLGNLVFSSLALFFLYQLCVFMTKNAEFGLATSLALALSPQFIAHSQNNPLDLVTLFIFVCAMFVLMKAINHFSASYLWLSSFILGWAFTTRPMCIVIVGIMFSWIVLRGSLNWKNKVPRLGFIFLLAMPFSFLMWPWLWADPVQRTLAAFHHLKGFTFDIHEIYMGSNTRVSQLPWHYMTVHFFSSIPVPYLILFLFSFLIFSPRWKIHKELVDAQWLGMLWFFSGSALSIHSPLCYNGWRHFLFILPGFCLMVGVGAALLLILLPFRVGRSVVALFYAIVLIQMIQYHPLQGAYVNEITNFFIPKETEKYLSIEYFGEGYVEGARWLNQHAEKDAIIMVPIFRYVANVSLRKKASGGSLDEYQDTFNPCYVMYITRGSMYSIPLVKYLEASDEVPVYTLRRGHGTVLKIYKNLPNG